MLRSAVLVAILFVSHCATAEAGVRGTHRALEDTNADVANEESFSIASIMRSLNIHPSQLRVVGGYQPQTSAPKTSAPRTISPPVEPKTSAPQTISPPAEPKTSAPQTISPPVEPKTSAPQTISPPVEPKTSAPQHIYPVEITAVPMIGQDSIPHIEMAPESVQEPETVAIKSPIEDSGDTTGNEDIAGEVNIHKWEPKSDKIPGFGVLDQDGSGRVTMDEFAKYTKGLKFSANRMISRANDPTAKRFLMHQTEFHYRALKQCIKSFLPNAASENGIVEEHFDEVTNHVAQHCRVRLETTFLAGPLVFEQIARRNPTITVDQIRKRFSKEFVKAELLASKMKTTDSSVGSNLLFIKECARDAMAEADKVKAELTRDDYYSFMSGIEVCISENLKDK